MTLSSSSGLWSRKCTCAVDTESDSDADSDGEPHVLDPASPERNGSAATAHTRDGTAAAHALMLDLHLNTSHPLPLARKTSGVRDPIQTSHALHNSEALRQAQTLQNVFCACYETETVLSLVQKRERTLSPMQLMLLEPENVAQVFIYATHFPDRSAPARSSSSRHLHHHHHHSHSHSYSKTGHHSHKSIHSHHHARSAVLDAPPLPPPPSQTLPTSESPLADPEKYRRPYIATEIIVRFYLKALTWHGSPKMLSSTSPASVLAHAASSSSGDAGSTDPTQDTSALAGNGLHSARSSSFSSPLDPSRATLSVEKSPETKPKTLESPSPKPFLLGITGSFRRAAFVKTGSSSSSSSSTSSRHSDTSDAHAAVRGYILHLEDLTLVEWKRIFSGLYRFLWLPLPRTNDDKAVGKTGATRETGIDSVLLANMCRITKNFAVYPSVHAILSSIDAPEGETLFARLASHAYNPEVASLLHGLLHLARARAYAIQPIVRSLVAQLIYVPAERPLPSATSSTSQFNLRQPLVHARISGCADVLVKVLTHAFPNTFCYYIQTKLQLASYESVEAFERELYPPKVLPNDRALHGPLQAAVLTALLEHADILTRVAEVGVAEIRYLDANYTEGAGIPSTLVLDVLKCAIDYVSATDPARLRVLVPPVQLVVETLCAAINYHQHISTISEFASRDCFSDSDSEDSESDADHDYDVNGDHRLDAMSDDAQNQSSGFVQPPRVLPIASATSATRSPANELARRHLQLSLIEPPVTCVSPTSGKRVINHRPLASILLVIHVVEFMDAVIRIGRPSLDRQLAKFGLAQSLLDMFERFPKANILQCRIVKLYLNLFDRVAPPGGRVTNPLLRSVFRPPDSILTFILHKLHASAGTHPYDAHLAILGVKIDKICSSPRLEQELIRQYCNSIPGWTEFSSSLVASHYQQIDALDDAVLGISSLSNGTMVHGLHGRRGSDGADDVFPLARPSSSATGFLSQELEPFRRLPIEKEGFGSPLNLATGTDAVSPTDMFRSRSQSQYPQSIIDVLKADTGTSLDAVEDDASISGFVYQKRAKWVKVHLHFDKESCLLTLEDVIAPATSPSPTASSSSSSSSSGATSPAKPKSASKLKQFIMAKAQHWTSRPKKLVVCNARKWIAFGRSVKHPGIGAFGFQVEAFDRSREVDQTLTFVTRSDATRTLWYEGMQHAMTASQTMRNSITDEDDEANVMLVQCVTTKREHHAMLYHVVPNVHLLGPVVSPTFFIKSEVPEELPFWGTFHGTHGIIQYASLLTQCVRVVSVLEKRMYATGYSVIVEFDATFARVEAPENEHKPPAPLHLHVSTGAPGALLRSPSQPPVVTVSCTDTYLVSGNQLIGLTRTIADSEKLMAMLGDDE